MRFMKILMIDHAGFQLETRKTLVEDSFHVASVDTVSTLGDLYLKFQKDAYDVVMIDNTIENGQEYIDYILLTDPQQPILVVSDSVQCVIKRCGDCVEQHQIRRLNNPTPIKNIVRMINAFQSYPCDHYDEETNKIPL